MSGLAEFLRVHQSIELSVEVECSEEGIEAAIETANKGDSTVLKPLCRTSAADIWAKAIARPKAAETHVMLGKCTLSLDQLSSDGVVKQVLRCTS